MNETYKDNYLILIAKIGDVNLSLPIVKFYNIALNCTDYQLIDDTTIYGQYNDDGVFVIRIFDKESEIMKNVLKCMSLVTCYDFSKQMDALNPSEDDNMQVGRILRPTSEIKMWSK